MKRFALLFPLMLGACVNPINLHTANEYYQGGRSNAAQGKWFNARMAFGRAWTNANLGKADDRVTAVYAYEYGRASGAICDWVESEKGLLKALELDQKTSGPVHMSFVELARMYYVKGNLENSNRYFSLAKEALDKIQADTRDSIAYADFLKEYAEVLLKLNQPENAKPMLSREEEIRRVFQGRKSNHDKTPYGEYCDQKSLTFRFGERSPS